jgi:hypothetical protein
MLRTEHIALCDLSWLLQRITLPKLRGVGALRGKLLLYAGLYMLDFKCEEEGQQPIELTT